LVAFVIALAGRLLGVSHAVVRRKQVVDNPRDVISRDANVGELSVVQVLKLGDCLVALPPL
jgi:hypothetical protein